MNGRGDRSSLKAREMGVKDKKSESKSSRGASFRGGKSRTCDATVNGVLEISEEQVIESFRWSAGSGKPLTSPPGQDFAGRQDLLPPGQ